MTDEGQPAPDTQTEAIIRAYVMIRDQRAELAEQYKANDAALKEKMNKLGIALAGIMQSVNVDQLSCRGIGTAYREVDDKFSAGDWPTVWTFIKENDRFDMLQKRLGEGAIKQYWEETGELPPGVNVHREYVIKVRRN